MTPLKRRIAAVTAPVFLALSLTACGGGAPTDATEKEFCKAYIGDTAELTEQPSDKELLEIVQKQVEDLEEVGTPKGISDDEREGFEIYVDKLGDLNEDDVKKLNEAEGDEDKENDILGVSDDESKKAEKFSDYADDTCAEAATE